ncbi:MAG: hypothetical protein JST54_28975 [Deltaproteobacteria bacterium]|nr:hypothetical protein [Deltaproteobacteria bacterium]
MSPRGFAKRIARAERAAPRPTPPDTPELRAAWCRENGLPEDTVLIGWPGPFVICLPAIDEPC